MMIREIVFADWLPQIGALIAANWEESGLDFPLDPDAEFYRELQDAGQLIALGAFDGDEMVGYSTATLTTHIFNPAVTVCQNDATFVLSAYRHGVMPGRMIMETERLARERGATLMMWSVPPFSALHGALAKRGYDLDEVSMTRRLS